MTCGPTVQGHVEAIYSAPAYLYKALEPMVYFFWHVHCFTCLALTSRVEAMLVQFVRDVVIVVALLAALIAASLPTAPEADVSPRLKPSLDTRAVAPAGIVNDSIAIQPATLSAAPAK